MNYEKTTHRAEGPKKAAELLRELAATATGLPEHATVKVSIFIGAAPATTTTTASTAKPDAAKPKKG